MVKTLERISKKAPIAICGSCGNIYNLAQRLEQVKNKPKPNTAGAYCVDACWIQESHNEDFS